MFLQARKEAAAASGLLVMILHASGLPCFFPTCGLKIQYVHPPEVLISTVFFKSDILLPILTR